MRSAARRRASAESRSPPTSAFEKRMTLIPRVFRTRVRSASSSVEPFVLFSVQLDRELRSVAIEIDDEAVDRNLPPKFRSVQSQSPRASP